MSLADDFINSLSESQFTYRRARDWLIALRFGRPVYQSQVYDLIINPLLQRGLASRVGRGLYILQGSERVLPASLNKVTSPNASPKSDEFAVYLREKGVKP